MPECGHTTTSANGGILVCNRTAGHTDLHQQTVQLRDHKERTNWGDDGLGIWATKGRNLNGHWTMHR